MKTTSNSRRLALLAGAFVLVAGAAAAQNKEPFKIGAIYPMTGIGASAGYSSEIGTRLAVRDINAAGGILGRQIQLIITDDVFDPTQSVGLAKRLVTNDKVDVVLGPQAGGLALAAAPIMSDANVLYFSVGSTGQLVPKTAPTFFSMQPLPEEQGFAMLHWAAEVRKAKTVAFLTDNSANSKTMAEPFRPYAEKLGMKVTTIEQFEIGSTDMTPQLLTMRRANPDVLLVTGSTAADMANVLKNIDEIGWNVPLGGSSVLGILYAPIAKMVGPKVIKRVSSALQVKSFTYCAGDPLGQSDYAKFLARLKAEDPKGFEQTSYSVAVYMYDALHFVKAAAEGTGGTDGRKMAAWIEANAPKVKALSGVLKASPTSHFLANVDTITMIDDPDTIRSDGTMKRAGC